MNKCCRDTCVSGGCVVVCGDGRTVLCQLIRDTVCLLARKGIVNGIGRNVLIWCNRP